MKVSDWFARKDNCRRLVGSTGSLTTISLMMTSVNRCNVGLLFPDMDDRHLQAQKLQTLNSWFGVLGMP